MPPMPKFSTKTFVTFGLRNAGNTVTSVILFTPRYKMQVEIELDEFFYYAGFYNLDNFISNDKN